MKLYNTRDIFVAVILSLFITVPMIFLFIQEGSITITKPYHDEYKDCLSQIKDLQKTVQCPEVRCDCGTSGFVMWLFGFLLLISGVVMFLIGKNKFEESKDLSKKKR